MRTVGPTKTSRILELFEKGHRPREIAQAVPCHISSVYAAIGARGRELVYAQLRELRAEVERLSREVEEINAHLGSLQALPDLFALVSQLRGR